MPRKLTIVAFLAFAGCLLSSPLSPAQALSADSCVYNNRPAGFSPPKMDTTCKHHLNLPDRNVKVSG